MRRVAALLPIFIVSVLALTINSNQESWFISTPADNNCTKIAGDIKQNVGPGARTCACVRTMMMMDYVLTCGQCYDPCGLHFHVEHNVVTWLEVDQ